MLLTCVHMISYHLGKSVFREANLKYRTFTKHGGRSVHAYCTHFPHLFFSSPMTDLVFPVDQITLTLKTLNNTMQVGQMTQVDIGVFVDLETGVLDEQKLTDFVTRYRIGSLFNTPFAGSGDG